MKKDKILLASSMLYSSLSVASIIGYALTRSYNVLIVGGLLFILMLCCLYGCYLYSENEQEVNSMMALVFFIMTMPITLLYVIFKGGGDN